MFQTQFVWLRWIRFLFWSGLFFFLFVGCDFPRNYRTEPEPIVPSVSNPSSSNTPPVERTPTKQPPKSPLLIWKKAIKQPSLSWKGEKEGALFCRVTNDQKELWCFDLSQSSFVRVLDSESKIIHFASSPKGERIAVLLQADDGIFALQVSQRPFSSFRTLRTFPQKGAVLSHVAFLQKKLVVYGKGVMYSESDLFLKPLQGSGDLPFLSALSFLSSGRFLAIDQETGNVMLNAPTSITSWSVMPPPKQDLQARAKKLAVHGDALAIAYNDGSLFWRCSDDSGFRLKRFEQKILNLFWFRDRYGLHLAASFFDSVQQVSQDAAVVWNAPDTKAIFSDVASIGKGYVFLQTESVWLTGRIQPMKKAILCR